MFEYQLDTTMKTKLNIECFKDQRTTVFASLNILNLLNECIPIDETTNLLIVVLKYTSHLERKAIFDCYKKFGAICAI